MVAKTNKCTHVYESILENTVYHACNILSHTYVHLLILATIAKNLLSPTYTSEKKITGIFVSVSDGLYRTGHSIGYAVVKLVTVSIGL
jgi:hypothetical protein